MLRTTAGLVLVLLLSWFATAGMNRIYGFAGRREGAERLNPLLVQIYPSRPADGRPYFSFQSKRITSELNLVAQGETLRIEGNSPPAAADLAYEFQARLAEKGAYELFVEPIVGRGFVTVTENPSVENGYRAKLRIDDPYFAEGEYSFRIWYRSAG